MTIPKRIPKRMLRACGLLVVGVGFLSGCWFDDTLREYLNAKFWLPFSKHARHFENRNVRRVSVAFAGMVKAQDATPLNKLRAAYQELSEPSQDSFDPSPQKDAVAAARADMSLTRREREEVDLIDAKIDMRAGQPVEPQSLQDAKKKLEQFLRTAQTPEYLSEARGWLAHIHFLLGEQTAAGKIYLDELNRNGSNLSRETLLNSLQLTYGYDGGGELYDHLEEYFDTPEHAAFAIEIATNPHWERGYGRNQEERARPGVDPRVYARIHELLQQHSDLLKSAKGSHALALLSMRTALNMGDPRGAEKIAGMVAANDAVRAEPDFNWMLASAHFLSHEYAAAERPLLDLFESPRSSKDYKAAAAYSLCGVYQKTNNAVEQLRYALWLRTAVGKSDKYLGASSQIGDRSVYWAASGWDLDLLLDAEAPIDALQVFLGKYPNMPDIRVVRYSLAVRLARENRYEEAAQIYQSIRAVRRAPRMRQLAALYAEANRKDVPAKQAHEAAYRIAELISDHSNGIYFNDALWGGLQRYAMVASNDSRLTREERNRLINNERKLKDEQEERWRAYLILRDVAVAEAKTDLGRKAARLAIHCLRGLSDRFGRESDIRKADIEISKLLRQ